MQIVMTGFAGDIGGLQLANENRKKLEGRFAPSYLKRIFSVELQEGSYDSLYRQLWRLGAEAGRGLVVYHELIPIHQETIEVCELFEINPYEIETSGRLYLAPEAEKITDGVVIGRLTDNNDRKIIMKEGERFLERVREAAQPDSSYVAPTPSSI